MNYRLASLDDVDLLAELNQQLICDESSRNRMTLSELRERMAGWLRGPYRAVVFEEEGEILAYVLFRPEGNSIYLRQFFVARSKRRQGVGRQAMEILRRHVFPADTPVTVDVLVHNRAALEFWRAVGFQDYALTMELLPETKIPAMQQV
jgi:ribosomal protein S18 acetylase RimI-like enzyme